MKLLCFFFFLATGFSAFRLLSLLVSCLLAVLVLTAKEMIERAIQYIKVWCLDCYQTWRFLLGGLFSPSCPNSKETLGGKQIYKQGADKNLSFHEESDCRRMGVQMPIVCGSQR